MPSEHELLQFIPDQWVGILALAAFVVTLTTNLVEKYENIARRLPLGTWWHDRAKKKRRRADWIAEDNQVIEGLQDQIKRQNEQLASIAAQMENLEAGLRCFRAWSVYDARWHHRVLITNAENDDCSLPRHYDYFEFERIWRDNPITAARLSYLEETLEGP